MKTILEFDGFINEIRENIAYVTLTDSDGEEVFYELEAKLITSEEIKESKRFKCKVLISIEPALEN